jgi:hypothetical protein
MTARIHHYIPRCYLKGFAGSRSKNAKLLVVDGKMKRHFVTTSKNVAAEKDFNRLDIPGIPLDALENDLSKFETDLDRALGTIITTRSFAHAEDRALIFNLMALLAVRNPRWRETMRDAMEQTSDIIMGLTLATKERYESEMRKARDAGFVTGKDVPYEEMKEFHEKRQYRVTVPTMRQIDREIRQQEVVLPYLFNRKWILAKARSGHGTFITSDHPVCLMWSDAKLRDGFYPPGFGLRGTEVYFPLSKDLALIGTFEGEEREQEVEAAAIAALNGAQIAYAERQVFATDERTAYLTHPDRPPRRVVDAVEDPIFVHRETTRRRRREA